MKQFELVNEKAASLLYEANTADYAGLKRITNVVAMDVQAISGKKPEVVEIKATTMEDLTQALKATTGDVILTGVVGAGGVVDLLDAAGLVYTKNLAGKRECYAFCLMFLDEQGQLHRFNELGKREPGAKDDYRYIWVVMGSERIGALYGLLEISRRIGVSDWCYWADAAPKKKSEIILSPYMMTYTSKEPSVRLRGFFMNDEWPSLGNWVSNTFGDFNVDFYEQVFVLLLRLRGNFLWPAMWSASFPIDGALGNTTETDPLANARLADELGITMSTSHHEPLMRASEEWDKVKTTENNVGYGKDWNYFVNAEGLHRYWYDGVTRNAPFKNLYTLGMRGERDSKIMGEDATMLDNVNLLKATILDQKTILKEHGLANAPKVLALYKEVEDYYYGDATTPGLADWEELDDVMLLLSDDNFANCRTLPTKDKMNRKAGWGLYYHFDYHGGPISYEWVNSTALEKVWDQMTMAYEYGIRDLWVVNVGDLRPQELPLSYFLALAYDFDAWGTKNPNKIDHFVRKWTEEQFGVEGATGSDWGGPECLAKIEKVLHTYTHMNANRRPEVVYETTFSVTDQHEAGAELQKIYELNDLCDELWEQAPKEAKAALYGLVYFPAVASANVRKMMIYAGYYNHYAGVSDELANMCHMLVTKAIEADKELTRRYHEEMADGKWKGMMMSNHVGFHRWNDEGWSYPKTEPIEANNGINAWCENNRETLADGVLKASALTWNNWNQESFVTISASKAESLEITGVSDLISVEVYPKFSGETLVTDEELDAFCAVECKISLNQNALPLKEDVLTQFTAVVDGSEIKVLVPIEAQCTQVLSMGINLIESDGYLAIECSDAKKYTPSLGGKRAQFVIMNRYGKYRDTMRFEPMLDSIHALDEAPMALYDFWICHEGTYELCIDFGPSNPQEKGKGQKFAFHLDSKTVANVDRSQSYDGVMDSLLDGFVAGDYNDWRWNQGVLDNIRTVKMSVELKAGMHRIEYFGVDPGVLLQRMTFRKK